MILSDVSIKRPIFATVMLLALVTLDSAVAGGRIKRQWKGENA